MKAYSLESPPPSSALDPLLLPFWVSSEVPRMVSAAYSCVVRMRPALQATPRPTAARLMRDAVRKLGKVPFFSACDNCTMPKMTSVRKKR